MKYLFRLPRFPKRELLGVMNWQPNQSSTLWFRANCSLPRQTVPITSENCTHSATVIVWCMYSVSSQNIYCRGLALATLLTMRASRASVLLQPFLTLFIHHLITASFLTSSLLYDIIRLSDLVRYLNTPETLWYAVSSKSWIHKFPKKIGSCMAPFCLI